MSERTKSVADILLVARMTSNLVALKKIIPEAQLDRDEAAKTIFDGLLDVLLTSGDGEYGFIGEVFYDDKGAPYLRTHAITDISWSPETKELYDAHKDSGMVFTNLKSLFGQVMTTEQTIISNCPAEDPRRTGLPEGHPPLNSFLGVPFFSNGEMIGMVGLSNRPGGFDEDSIKDLEPVTRTCANIISKFRKDCLKKVAGPENLSKVAEDLAATIENMLTRIKSVDA